MTRERVIAACQRAIDAGQTPGAVVLVGRGDEVLCHVAVGRRALVPEALPMRLDTVFDLASVTKPVATTTAFMQLVDAGLVGLRDPVAEYVPWLDPEGMPVATVCHLLTHTSGLPPWLPYRERFAAAGRPLPADDIALREAVVADICALPRETPPGERFVYSCLGFIVLADIIRRLTGQRLDAYCAANLWPLLATRDTCFTPSARLRKRCAATEQLPDGPLLGVVHDENARLLNGVGGNAGLFGTAADLARFCRMMLRGGIAEGGRVLSAAAVRTVTTPHSRSSRGSAWDIRALGWDLDTEYSPSLRGDYFGPRSFGHSGFTGTSVWIDPDCDGYVILLSNRVHLGREVTVQRLRYEVANIAAAMIT
jgi:serine-type D-Ala-D-Ala carboxypeptidase